MSQPSYLLTFEQLISYFVLFTPRCLVVVEAENGVELNMVGHASTVRDRISKSNRGIYQ